MKKLKLYQNKTWLAMQYKTKTAAQIAQEQGVTEMTITRYLTQFGLIKRPRTYRRGR